MSDLERGIDRYPYRSTVQSLVVALGLSEVDAAALFEASRRPGVTCPKLTSRRVTPRTRGVGAFLGGCRFHTVAGWRRAGRFGAGR